MISIYRVWHVNSITILRVEGGAGAGEGRTHIISRATRLHNLRLDSRELSSRRLYEHELAGELAVVGWEPIGSRHGDGGRWEEEEFVH